MCTAWIAAAGLASSLMGSVSNATAKQQAAAAQAEMYNAQSRIAENNADISRQQSEQVLAQAQDEKDELSKKVNSMTAMGRTNYAAGNVLLGSGSPANWEDSVAAEAAEDQTQIDYNASLKQWAYNNQANQYDAQSSIYNNSASNTRKSGWWDFGTSLLSGVGSTALTGATTKWDDLKW